VTQDEVIAWVENAHNAEVFIRGFDSVREGQTVYSDLAELVGDGTVTFETLPGYGFPMPGSPELSVQAAPDA
jgi:hypothetical protein